MRRHARQRVRERRILLTAALAATGLAASPAAAYDSTFRVPNGKAVEGPPTARARWRGGEPGAEGSDEHARVTDWVFAHLDIPPDAVESLHWQHFGKGDPLVFRSNQYCPLPEPEDDRSFLEKTLDFAGAMIGAVLHPVETFEDLKKALLAEALSLVYNAPCNQGVCTGDDDLGPALGRCVWTGPSYQPVPFDQVGVMAVRTYTPAELAQLPDAAWTLEDLISGMENCPLTDALGAADCHSFEKHMGAYNSSHFVPQSQTFYRHYHRLALARAAECRSQREQLGDEADDRLRRFQAACEGEAWALEAVAQHYLQDAWSMGHTWERWGAPVPGDLSTFANVHLVGLVVGLIHGAKAITYLDDPLNAPDDRVRWSAEGHLHGGVGDLFFELLATDPAYADQRAKLLGCAGGGFDAVYRALGEPMGRAPGGEAPVALLDPESDACFGQRATNRAMRAGAAQTVPTPLGEPLELRIEDHLLGEILVRASASKRDADLTGPEVNNRVARLQASMGVLSVALNKWAVIEPEGTQMATTALPALLGVERNGVYANREGLPAPWVDPALPWSARPGEPTEPLPAVSDRLAHGLNAGRAAEWCGVFDGNDPTYTLDRLAARVSRTQAEANLGDPVLGKQRAEAACAVCLDIAQRHIRVGTGPEAYDHAVEPVCGVLAPDTAEFKYVPNDYCLGSIVPAYLRQAPEETFCGCSYPTSSLAGGFTSASGGGQGGIPGGGGGGGGGAGGPGGGGGPGGFGGPGYCWVGCGRSLGDPHLTSFDGLGYDFQAAGEFVLAVREAPGFAVQVRQEPASGRCSSVSQNTAVAARIGGVNVVMDAATASVRVDGQLLERGSQRLSDCSVVSRDANGARLLWATGEILEVGFSVSLDVRLDVSGAPDEAYSGLLGDADGNAYNDLRTRDGVDIEAPVEAPGLLHGAYADSWRVTADERLFADLPGAGHGAFDVPGFPFELDDLSVFSANDVALAEAACADAGVLGTTRLRECALDVVCTDDTARAASFAGQPEPILVGTPPPNVARSGCFVLGRDVTSEAQPVARVGCPADCFEQGGTVWGTDVYTDDSPVCLAAIHAGVVAAGAESQVQVTWRPGQETYVGTPRNGVTSSDYGSWGGSFVVDPVAD